MTIAADDGVMPQTREHAAVLGALGVTSGVVAISKCDLEDPEAAAVEAAELLPDAEIVAVSARTSHGLGELQAALERAAASVRPPVSRDGAARLHVDRVFTIRGAGTVVTGTLWSGSIGRGDQLELLPQGRRARVRAVQVHDQATERAPAGQRVAVNLTGIAVADVARGDVLASADSELQPTYLIDARLSFGGREPEHGERVQVHHGTREAPSRLSWLGGAYWQIRLERPLVPARDDRLVIRQIAPPDTLGGGRVLDPHPRKHGPSRDVLLRLEALARGEAMPEPPRPKPAPAPVQARPEPLSASALALEEQLREAGLEPPLDTELPGQELAALRAAGRAVRVSRNLHYHADALAEVRARVVALANANGGSITLSALRDELGTSRKFAQALLEHFDSEKLTIRRGDEHVLRRDARPALTSDRPHGR
jgi:selenocysteine-specific elongation factor